MNTNLTPAQSFLFPKVRQSILGLLYTHSEQKFYTNEIIRYVHSGTGSVQRELANLTNAELVKVSCVGNQKQYQANDDSSVFLDLKNIVLKTFGLADILKKALKPFAEKIQFAFIYGSIASNQEKQSSDIDLMILSDVLSYADIFPVITPLEEKLSRSINPVFYTNAEWKKRKNNNNHFVHSVINKSKIFLIGNENEFNKF